MILKSYPLRLQFLINESTDYGEMKKVNKRWFRQMSFIWRRHIPAKTQASGNPIFCWRDAMSVNRKIHSIHSAARE